MHEGHSQSSMKGSRRVVVLAALTVAMLVAPSISRERCIRYPRHGIAELDDMSGLQAAMFLRTFPGREDVNPCSPSSFIKGLVFGLEPNASFALQIGACIGNTSSSSHLPVADHQLSIITRAKARSNENGAGLVELDIEGIDLIGNVLDATNGSKTYCFQLSIPSSNQLFTAVISEWHPLGSGTELTNGQKGSDGVQGSIRVYGPEPDRLVVQGRIDGLKPNSTHGLHVHRISLPAGELDDCVAASADNIYNPLGSMHGSLLDTILEREMGAFGNIQADVNGVSSFLLRSVDTYLWGPWSIIGLTWVLNEAQDDFIDARSAGPPLRCGSIYALPLAVQSRAELSGSSGACGELVTSQMGDLSTNMQIQGYLAGLQPGQSYLLTLDSQPAAADAGVSHGDAVCSADGTVFNPFNASCAVQQDGSEDILAEKAPGELGVIQADDTGVAAIDITVDGLATHRWEGIGDWSIANRPFTVRAVAGNESDTHNAAGTPVACGLALFCSNISSCTESSLAQDCPFLARVLPNTQSEGNDSNANKACCHIASCILGIWILAFYLIGC